MFEVAFAVLLMSFLLWSYNILNKNFIQVDTGKVTPAKSNSLSSKRLLITITLFLGCFAFISMIIQHTKNDLTDEIRQEQIIQAQGPSLENPIIFEQPKFKFPDKHKEINILQPDQIKTKFSDVAGLIEAKAEMQDIISYLQSPSNFGRLGAKPPKGVLLHGYPGTGKTMMARAVAGEAEVAFISVAGAEFDEEYVGVGAARVRQLFEVARQNAPCIIFIDEIDALAHKRNNHDPAWSSQTVNQLLAEMDGLDSEQNEGIIVIGASNRIDAIDSAILRPGRLDRHIELEIPTQKERSEILQIYISKVKTNAKVKAHDIAKITAGFSSAELANLVNEAAIIATKANKQQIDLQDFEAAKDRMVLGSQRQSLEISARTKKITAFHEAGHALVGHLLGNHQPLYKVTIAPRGPSLGHTAFEPKADNTSVTQSELEAGISTMLAGRIAEEIIFGKDNITTGAESDLQHATDLAHSMVTRWGFSERVGLIYNGNENIVSDRVIEEEIQEILARCYERAYDTLYNNQEELTAVANALLEHETIDAKELQKLISKNKKGNGKTVTHKTSK